MEIEPRDKIEKHDNRVWEVIRDVPCFEIR